MITKSYSYIYIAVIIPVYNEEFTIGKVIDDFHKHLPDAKIYVYDNNSTDKTVQIAKDHGAIVRHEYKQGKGNVVRSMFRDINADCYILVDGDDTYPASSAKAMADIVLNYNCDMVIGDRLSSTYFTENKRKFHNSGNRLVRYLINTMFKNHILRFNSGLSFTKTRVIDDIMTGYRAFSPMFVKTFPVLSQGFEIETEMTIHALDKNLSIASLPIDYKDRPNGSTSKLNTYKDGMRVLYTIFSLFKNYKPLFFFSILSFFIMILGCLAIVPVVQEYFATSTVRRVPTFVGGCFLILSSLASFFCGLILDVISHKHKQDFEIKLNEIKMLLSRFTPNDIK